jgi:alpha-L-rhamnosidase
MLTVENLRCENLTNPLCIDAERPRLSWMLSSPERAKRQRSYRILVA